MSLLLSHREREVLEIVRDLEDPHALEIIESYHQRYELPLEPINIIRALQGLVAKGHLEAEKRPAPAEAPYPERVHFVATDLSAEATSLDTATRRALQPSDTDDFEHLIRLALQHSPRTKVPDPEPPPTRSS